MSVIRINKTDNYTVMSNHHLRNMELSLKAIGLLSKILSLPDEWEYSVAGLISICKESKSAVESALQELKDTGYLVIEKLMPDRTASGRIEYVYNIYETPELRKQEDKKQDIENQGLENQDVENQKQLNTDELNTDSLTKEVITYLNEMAGTQYRASTRKTKELIKARINEGFTEQDFYNVIDKKWKEWKGTEWEKYLRPQTLFGTKFEAYLNQPVRSNNPFLDMIGNGI